MHVFGYGSLFGLGALGGGIPCRLSGYRRSWNVAMDNAVDLPGYKYYVDAATGQRPAAMVAFLNIQEDPGGCLNGLVFAVESLDVLDDRERNYRRCDVADRLSVGFGGPVWAYVGLDAARRRFELGAAERRVGVSREYHDGVLAGFGSLGAEMLDEFRATTDAPGVPLLELVRIAIDVPPTGFTAPTGPPAD